MVTSPGALTESAGRALRGAGCNGVPRASLSFLSNESYLLTWGGRTGEAEEATQGASPGRAGGMMEVKAMF